MKRLPLPGAPVSGALTVSQPVRPTAAEAQPGHLPLPANPTTISDPKPMAPVQDGIASQAQPDATPGVASGPNGGLIDGHRPRPTPD